MCLLCEPYLLATPLCRTSPLAWGSINAFLAFTKLQHAAAAKMKRNKQKRGGGKGGGWGGEEEKEATETEKTKQMTRSCNFDINCSKCNSTRQCRRHLPRHPFPLCLPLSSSTSSTHQRQVTHLRAVAWVGGCQSAFCLVAWEMMPNGCLKDASWSTDGCSVPAELNAN